ncbi:MAG: exo-alpha-sialidase [Clostridia bacterium]|nr:exo-alpha-sialidase [Clostridia bacterium]
MKTHKNWSYSPYKPLFIETGDIYICRLAPSENSVTVDYLSSESEFSVFYRVKGETEFIQAGKTTKKTFTIENLAPNCDYEIMVCSGDKKSRIRLVRVGESVGLSVINYLHPDDEVYAFSGRYLCSPSIVRHPSGYLLASMDLYAHAHPQNLTLIYRSDDDGKSWRYACELFPCFWAKLFVHNGDIYCLGASTEYGDLLIGKSTDGGYTFGEPTVLLRGGNGKNGEAGVHKNPQPVVEFNGRIYNTFEWGAWGRGYHAMAVMSAPDNADLLDANSWTFSEPTPYNSSWVGTAKGNTCGNLEGGLVDINRKLKVYSRYDTANTNPSYGKIVVYSVDTVNPENPIRFDKVVDFNGNMSKFEVKFDRKRNRYYSIGNYILNHNNRFARNLLALYASPDGEKWEVDRFIYDYRNCDKNKVGFQYVDFEIEDDEIIFMCRTAINGANSFHDSNYMTFDKIKI